MKIAVIPNVEKPSAISCAEDIAKLFLTKGAEVLMPETLKNNITDTSILFFPTYDEIFENADCAVTVGGDGTIIHTARYAAVYSKPIIGVNLGRLGYVAELEPSEINMLSRLLCGDFVTCERMMLEVSVIHKDGKCDSYLAVNDAVISRGSLSRIIDLDVFVEGERISNYRADGLLFSTPTGSTAYALSAGGPVIDPCLSLIELTPICPHSLTARTVIFTDDTVLSVSCNSPESSYLTIDGQISVEIGQKDTVRISKSCHKLKMNVLKLKNFYKVAGEKLDNPNL
ncbi:MAG: NAD(+)/NADH kinase [Ruminococcus sp.]|nr:NAD(+)/NADH kinase [Ruminococcus sp.]